MAPRRRRVRPATLPDGQNRVPPEGARGRPGPILPIASNNGTLRQVVFAPHRATAVRPDLDALLRQCMKDRDDHPIDIDD